MNLAEVMQELEALGTAQNRKIYARHGADENMFGVSFANLEKLRKRIKVDHELAVQLWATGNHDAQILATMIADPQQFTNRQAESWAKSLSNYGLALMLTRLIAKTSFAQAQAEKWCKAKAEWIGSAGWCIISHLAMNDQQLPDAYFVPYLTAIGESIHQQKNFVRYEMNSALIAIGLRNEKLEKRALAVAKQIGKVEVDHGQTGCKTPDATAYIAKALAYRHKKAAKAAAKK
jgi:3-methyladenine DNA glycosylase AlkD